MIKNCVISAVGKNSLHKEWIKETSLFDLHLVVYDDSIQNFRQDTSFVVNGKGYKFKLVYDYLTQNPEFINQYDYFFIPDDDIRMDSANIERLFEYMEEYDLMIAQSALSDSYYTYEHTMKQRGTLLRYTNFVEVMVPCFSREALKKTLFTFNENVSGWGIDFHWSELIGFTGKEMAVIDDLHCMHTRPVQSCSEHNVNELHHYLQKYNLKREISECGQLLIPEKKQMETGNWIPVITLQDKLKSIEAKLDIISRALLSGINSVDEIGLSSGKIGISLFFFNYYRLTGKRKYYDIGLAIFESIYNSISKISGDISLSNGLSGVSWTVEYLAQNGFIEENTDEILEEICTVLDRSPLIISLGSMTVGSPEGDLKTRETSALIETTMTLNEVIGYGMHYLSRMRNPNFQPERNANHLTEKFITFQIVDYLDSQKQQFDSQKVDPASEHHGLFVEEDYASLATIIFYLSRLQELNPGHSKIRPLLTLYIEMVGQEQNYKDDDIRNRLFLANALLHAAKVTNTMARKEQAINLALSINSVILNEVTRDNAVSIAHLYNLLYQQTSVDEFKKAAENLIDRTLAKDHEEDIVLELLNDRKYGLHNGLAGAGLALIAAIADFEPKWDEVAFVFS